MSTSENQVACTSEFAGENGHVRGTFTAADDYHASASEICLCFDSTRVNDGAGEFLLTRNGSDVRFGEESSGDDK